MAPRAAIRRITAPVQERLNRLADILYDFLPLSSRSTSAVTFTSIFAASGVAHYLHGPTNKRQALQRGLTELYRRHEKLPFTVIRKVVPTAVGYRKYIRKPLTRVEVNALASCLADLELDMTTELAGIELDEALPRITIPPDELKRRLRAHDLDPALASEPLDLFEAGHFNDAVRKAMERFEDRIRDLSGLSAHGRDLMARAFADGRLLTATLQPENRQDFEEGVKFLTMGAMAAIRNVFSHGDEERRAPEECYEMLLFVNWLFRAVTVRT